MAELDKFVEEQKHDGVTIELTVNEVNVVLGALAELPHRVSDPVIRKVFTQAQQQLQAQ
jgi:hypothetical protein